MTMTKINTMWCIFLGANLLMYVASYSKPFKALAVCKLAAWINSFIIENNWKNPFLSGRVYKPSIQSNK